MFDFNPQPQERPRVQFIIAPPEDHEGWSVIYNIPGDEPEFLVQNLTHFSSAAQLMVRGMRMFEDHSVYDIEVIDPSGEWEHWMTHTKWGTVKERMNIPEHFC